MRTSALQYLYLQKPISTAVIICAIAILPWLNDDFYTRGEPREAAVAASMLKSGNWILPEVYADELANKPPMAYWLMALCSLPQGEVTEFTSRLPSAIAQLILIGCVLAFFGKRIRFQEAFIATFLLMTCFEIHRAGTTARVDMLLTTFIVLGLMQLYRWENKLNLKGLPVLVPLLFSCAILTRGLVEGIVLPLFVYGIYLLILRKYRWKKILKSLAYVCISSLFLPSLWYIAAYQQGEGAFLTETLADNFGYLFNSDAPNSNYELGRPRGLFYNFRALLIGFSPWSLLFILALFAAKWRLPHKSFKRIIRDSWRWFISFDKMKRFSIIATVCILFFYTLPASKKGAYIMQAYPFISILLAQYLIYITENRSQVTRIFAYILTTVISIIFLAGILTMTQAVDLPALFGRYTDAVSDLHPIKYFTNAFSESGVFTWMIMGLLLISIVTVVYQTSRRINIKILYGAILMTFCMNLFTDGIIMKSIKNNMSSRPFAEQISRDYDLKDKVYVMNDLPQHKNLYGMNFYMGNTFHDFEEKKPQSGFFLAAESDVPEIMETYGSHYHFEQLAVSGFQGDIRDHAVLFRFHKSLTDNP